MHRSTNNMHPPQSAVSQRSNDREIVLEHSHVLPVQQDANPFNGPISMPFRHGELFEQWYDTCQIDTNNSPFFRCFYGRTSFSSEDWFCFTLRHSPLTFYYQYIDKYCINMAAYLRLCSFTESLPFGNNA